MLDRSSCNVGQTTPPGEHAACMTYELVSYSPPRCCYREEKSPYLTPLPPNRCEGSLTRIAASLSLAIVVEGKEMGGRADEKSLFGQFGV